jgi:two-component system, OmpR family, sensor histidine kinase KdpD
MEKTDQNHDLEPFFDSDKASRKERIRKLMQFLIIMAMLILTTVINMFLEPLIQSSSLVFVYLVPAIAGAVYFGIWAAVLSFTAGFLIFDFAFVQPYYTLHISNPQDVYNIIVYFIVAVLITYLINVVHRQNIFLKGRLNRVSLIEDMSRDLLLLTPFEQTYSVENITFSLKATVFSQLGQLALRYTKMILDVPALVFFRDDDGSLKVWAKSSVDMEITEQAYAAAIWTFDNGEVSGSGTNTFSENRFYFYPMKSIEGTVGVIGILYNSKDLFPEQRYLMGTISNLITIVATTWMNLNVKEI